MIRTSGAALAGLALLTLTVACSSGGADGSAAVRHLVLTQTDLPAGFETVKLDKDQFQLMTDQLHDATSKVTVTPSPCAAPGSVPSRIDTKSTATMAARSDDYAISQSVQAVAPGSGDADLSALGAKVSGECRTVRVDVASGPIKDSQIHVDYTVLPSPAAAGRDALVVESNSRTVQDDRSGSAELIVGRAVRNGYAVTVQMAPLAGGGLDRATFEKIFAAAVDRVAG